MSLNHLVEFEGKFQAAMADGKIEGSSEDYKGSNQLGFYSLLLRILAAAPQGGHSPEAGQARGVRDTTGASITFLLNGGEDFPQKELLKDLIPSQGLYELVPGEVIGYQDSFMSIGSKQP